FSSPTGSRPVRPVAISARIVADITNPSAAVVTNCQIGSGISGASTTNPPTGPMAWFNSGTQITGTTFAQVTFSTVALACGLSGNNIVCPAGWTPLGFAVCQNGSMASAIECQKWTP